jgi:mono/diheme cytochrome c family protein
VRTWPDGAVYHVISEGQNVMPGYAAQIGRDDRWAVVHYLRVLQRAHFAKESDLQ